MALFQITVFLLFIYTSVVRKEKNKCTFTHFLAI